MPTMTSLLKESRRLLLVLATCTATTALAETQAEPDAGPAPESDIRAIIQQRWTGHYGGMTEAGERAIRDADEWQQVWKKVYSNRSPVPKVPKVDFDKQMVLAVFLGGKNGGGYAISIESVRVTDDGLQVAVNRTSPSPDEKTATALTQPFDMVVVVKTDRPVKFE
jgi:hypothetical protein